MPALIQGYEYDIFISYRQNDNRSGWVTEFVKALQEELASTIKDPVSVYFDSNPHDGLLETHNVDKSLEGKLKCLIFIPILSQTYCDPKSFAWQREFCAFNKLASGDPLGSDITLESGNVASRILPVKIHELDANDKVALENELGSALRAIEFIFRSSGVNRPLLAREENPQDNINKTNFRDQINKLTNAIKEIVSAARHPGARSGRTVYRDVASTSIQKRGYVAIGLTIFVLLAGYFLYRKLTAAEAFEFETDKSVAVLPFVDLSPSKDLEWFSDGLPDAIINALANEPSIQVTARTSSFYYKGRNVPVKEIGKTLEVNYVLEGSIQKLENKMKIAVKLSRTSDGFNIWSQEFERPASGLMVLQNEIVERTLGKLLGNDQTEPTGGIDKFASSDSYSYYLKGLQLHNEYDGSVGSTFDKLDQAEQLFIRSISSDPKSSAAYGALADLYDTRSKLGSVPGHYIHLRDSVVEVGYKIDPNSSDINFARYVVFKNFGADGFDSAIFYLKRAYALEPGRAVFINSMGQNYAQLGLYELACKFYLKTMKIDPLNSEARRVYALIRMWNDDIDFAQSELEKLTVFNPNVWVYYHNLAFAQFMSGSDEKALTTITKEESITNSPCNYRVLFLDKEEMKKGLRLDHTALRPILLSKLGMKEEFLHYLDSITKLKICLPSTVPTNIAYTDVGLNRSRLFDFVRDDPRFREIKARVERNVREKARNY